MDVTYPDMLKSANSVIGKQVSMRRSFYNRNRVRLIEGHAKFVDKNTVQTLSNGSPGQTFSADQFVVATGSSPYRPPDVDFNHSAVHDSDTILQVDDTTPRSITIYGAGVIGCEYASIYGNLGLKVDLVNTRERLLEFLDDEITDALGYHLRNQGVVIRNNETIDKVEPLNDGVICIANPASGSRTTFCCGQTGAPATPRTCVSRKWGSKSIIADRSR